MGNTDNDTPIDLLADINEILEDADEITGELSPIQIIDGIITYGNGTEETVLVVTNSTL